MRLAVFLPNWIGDVVMATPALRALRKHFAATHMIGVMRPYVAEVLDGGAWFDEVVLYEKHARRLAGRPNVVKQLRAARPDQILLLTNSFRTAWLAWRSGARERIGYSGNLRSPLLTRPIVPPRGEDGTPWPTIDSYLHLVSQLGCPPEAPRLELASTAADERAADAVWRRFDLPPGERVVVLNSGGAYGAAKNWPVAHFAELATRIVSDWDGAVLVNAGPAERELVRTIAERADHPRVVSLADVENLPIGLTKACIRRSRMLVTTDSGPRFFGIAFGKPVVTLFGPTSPVATRTHYDRETCLSLALDCQPCMKRVCPLGHHRCMKELSVDRVYAEVARHLDTGCSTLDARSRAPSIEYPASSIR